jgi:AAA+ superfamily predicted ATPase
LPEISTHSDLNQVFSYLREVISWRISNPDEDFDVHGPELDPIRLGTSLPSQFVKEHGFSKAESIIVFLALVPHVMPDFLLEIVGEEFPMGTDYPIFGGVKAKNHRGIIPTGETVQFILAGKDLKKRMDCISYFEEKHPFSKEQLLFLDEVPKGEPLMSGKVLLTQDAIHLLTTGIVPLPTLSTDFPAERIETNLSWDDLVLSGDTLDHIRELEIWLHHNERLMEEWGMKGRIKEGYRVLMHGPPGTGKTLTASLLGKYTNRPVYRIDLSTVVSKYIGETEKNLSTLFNKAANKNWILFFDEADAIFGKRTNVRDAHDKYANQEVSYLLQRLENHPGLVILASNFKDNIDEAFTRRFQSIFRFELPEARERKLIWEKNIPKKLVLSEEINLDYISRKFDLTGSNIMNIIHFCSLKVLSQNSNVLTSEILQEGIKREYIKEDRIF